MQNLPPMLMELVLLSGQIQVIDFPQAGEGGKAILVKMPNGVQVTVPVPAAACEEVARGLTGSKLAVVHTPLPPRQRQ